MRAENLKPSHNGLIPGLLWQMVMVGGAGWWWCGSLEVVAATDIVFVNVSRVRGLRAENLKPSHYGLVPGLLCQMVMVGGAGWWWCISLKVVAVMVIRQQCL